MLARSMHLGVGGGVSAEWETMKRRASQRHGSILCITFLSISGWSRLVATCENRRKRELVQTRSRQRPGKPQHDEGVALAGQPRVLCSSRGCGRAQPEKPDVMRTCTMH